MSHKHHPKEARIRAVQQQDGGRPASEICKEMNITPGTLKRWRDQLHLLAPSDAALIREQEKMIEHMARVVAEQAVKRPDPRWRCPRRRGHPSEEDLKVKNSKQRKGPAIAGPFVLGPSPLPSLL